MITLCEFLSAFSPSVDEPIHLRAFPPKGAEATDENRPRNLTVTRRGLEEDTGLLTQLKQINQHCGLYFVVNSGGQTDLEISRYNAVFTEADDKRIEEQHRRLDASPLPTSIRIETARSVHAYWLGSPGTTEDVWRETQRGLVARFDGDPKLVNKSRVMRVPIYDHLAMNGSGIIRTPVKIVQFEPSRRYVKEEFSREFPAPTTQANPFVSIQTAGDTDPGAYGSWDELNVELRRRIGSHPTARKRPDGWIHCRGICHDGKSDSAIALNPATGAFHCQAKCNTADILRAFGLPEKPDGMAAEAHSQLGSHRISESREWEDPLPIEEAISAVEPLLPEMLPEAFRDWLFDVSERMNVPLDFPAASAIVALSACVGRRAQIYPKLEDSSWCVTPNLWGACVGRPGTQKTPAIAEGMVALEYLQKVALEENEDAKEDYARSVERFKIENAAWQDNAKKACKGGKEFQNFGKDRPQEPKPRRYITNDATAEKLHELLRDNPAGILYFRDELSGWMAQMDLENRSTDRGFLLEAWEGNRSYVIDRIVRGQIYAPVCCVSVLGGIQPSKLRAYLADAVNGGLTDDGLLQRLQVLVWPEISKEWKMIDRQPNKLAEARFSSVFKKLVTLDPGAPVCVHFEIQAQDLFYTWWPELEMRIRNEKESEAFAAHLSKYRSLMPSLALLFSLADWAVKGGNIPSSIGLEYARFGAIWCAYLESHARKVYACLASGGVASAKILAEKIQSGALPELFTARDAYRPQWAGLTRPEDVDRAAEILIDHNWLRLEAEEKKPGGGRSSKRYRVNPMVKRGEAQ